MTNITMRRLIGVVALANTLAACASNGGPVPADEQWAAHGYLTPGPTSEPDIIGIYDTKSACNDAVEAWMSQQVVGNPVSGECLPVDIH